MTTLPALSYPFPDLPAAGTTLPVAPGVEWVRMPLPYALDHINLWLLDEGAGNWTSIDTGFALEPVKAAWKSVAAGRQITRSIITHGHPDHLGLAAWLEAEYGAALWITPAEYTVAQLIINQVGAYALDGMLDFFAEHGLDAARIDALRQRGNAFKFGVPELPRKFQRIYPGDVLRIGTRDWRVIMGFGHAYEHVSLYCADLGVLVSGDMLLPRISTNVPALSMSPRDNPLKRFLDSLDDFLVLPEDTLVLPSHGRPFRGIHERVRQLRAHHESRFAIALAECATPKTATELIPALFEREIADAHQTMFALGEAVAHLNYLEHQGRLVRLYEKGISRYRIH